MTQFTLDLPTLHRHTIGFDRMFEELHRNFSNSRNGGTYPPYNIVKSSAHNFVIEIAVAGWSEDELDINLQDQTLTVSGIKKSTETEREYLHLGISSRNWQRVFNVYEMEIRGASVKNGILSIALEHVIPEEKKPKKIAITFEK